MKEAWGYARLFETGQYGKLYITCGVEKKWFQGYYVPDFYIQILPEGEAAIKNGKHNKCVNNDAIEVFGKIKNSEEYGWLHIGPWVADFEDLVEAKKAEIEERKRIQRMKVTADKIEEERRIQRLLDAY